MLTTKKAVEAKASSIATIKRSVNGTYTDDLFNSEVKKVVSTSIFFQVTDIDNMRSKASYKAKKQNLIKCN